MAIIVKLVNDQTGREVRIPLNPDSELHIYQFSNGDTRAAFYKKDSVDKPNGEEIDTYNLRR